MTQARSSIVQSSRASEPRRSRWQAIALVAVLGALLGCAGGELRILVDRTVVSASEGEVLVTVVVPDPDQADRVRLRAGYGRVRRLGSEGDRVRFRVEGLNDPSRSPVSLQASLDMQLVRTFVEVVPGPPARFAIAGPAWVSADAGRAEFEVAVLDVVGNLVAAATVTARTTVGEVVEQVPTDDGRLLVVVEGLHDVGASPALVSFESGTLTAVTPVTILAGAPGGYGFELPPTIQANVPVTVTIRSMDRWGNPRPAVGEVAYLRAYRAADPSVEIPISPVSTNLFEDGTVTMPITFHGPGPDVVLEVAADPSFQTATRSDPIVVEPAELRCVVVQPTGLDSRVQEATSFGRSGGFPLEVVLYAQGCRSIAQEGPRFTARIAGVRPKLYVHLADGTFWGSSEAPENGGEKVGPLGFVPDEVAWRASVTGLTNVSWSPVRVTAEALGRVGVVELEISPAAWRGIQFEPIPDQFQSLGFDLGGGVTATAGFAATLRAVDVYGNPVPLAQGTATCKLVDANFADVTDLSLTPSETVTATAGVINQYFTIAPTAGGTLSAPRDVRLACRRTEGVAWSYSNLFRVFPMDQILAATNGFPTDFMVVLPGQTVPDDLTANPSESPLPQRVGVPFRVRLVARAASNLLPRTDPVYEGNTYLTAGQGAVSTWGDGGERDDSPLTDRMAFVVTGTTNCLPPPFDNVCDTVGYYAVDVDVVVHTAADNQILITNPAVVSVPPALRGNTSLFPGASTAFVVHPGPAVRLRWVDDPPDEVTAGTSFEVTVEAIDAYGNVVTDHATTLQVDDLTHTVWPHEVNFSGGRATLSLTVWQPWERDVLTVVDPVLGATLESAPFDVLP